MQFQHHLNGLYNKFYNNSNNNDFNTNNTKGNIDNNNNNSRFTKGTAFGYINVYANKLVLNWTGKKPNSDIFPVWPTEML